MSVLRFSSVLGRTFSKSALNTSLLLHNSMRFLHSSPYNTHPKGAPMKIRWINKDDTVTEVPCREGDDLLQVAHANDIELEGACEGSRACSTCHVYLEQKPYDRLETEQPQTEDEEDMLDQAYELRPTSRLGCCVILDKSYDGMTVTLPKRTRNAYYDGAKPAKH